VGIGSSFIKHKVDGKDKIKVEIDLSDHEKAINEILKLLVDEKVGILKTVEDITGVGHRVVHGGEDFTESALVTDKVIKAIEDNSVLAPLHNPANLLGIRAIARVLPEVPQTAVFDTAIHQTMPKKAFMYALPKEMYESHKIRRYGFHGTSHGYVSQKAAEILGKPLESLKLITCHIGNGISITAFKDGVSVDTSMGLTPLEGVVMGTRAGDMDPYIPLYIMKTLNMTADEVNDVMNKKGGMLALSGYSDMRDVESRYENGDKVCTDAIDVYSYRIQKYIGAYTAAMGGVDAIIFTAGVGEKSPIVRGKVLENFSYLGLHLDMEANEKNATVLTTPDSKVKALVVPTDEELVIATDTLKIIEGK
ncbi:MAG: acetate kinase, partial [Alphaproteobacteria bacterium]|nr:acetate kinase [Alphaproteobacteria bacterium]